MALKLIHGPPNSGRTDLLLDRFLAHGEGSPVLVASGGEDIFRWQERLLERSRRYGSGRAALLGPSVITFNQLCAETLERAGRPVPERASELTRRSLMMEAIGSGWPELLETARRQHGIAESLLALVDDFRLNLKDPDTLEEDLRGSDTAEYLAKLVGVYRAYEEGLEAAGLSDTQGVNLTACRVSPDGWRDVPVHLAGFDDLSPLALELITRISEVTEVVTAFTYEHGSPALELTARTFGALAERAEAVDATETPAGAEDERPDTLRLVVERFMRGEPGSLEPDRSVGVIRSAGNRAEAEAVGAWIARLVAGAGDAGEGGRREPVEPDRIAIAVPSPETNGPLFREVLESYGVRASVESELRPADTAVGASLLALLGAAGPVGPARDLILHLRGPSGVSPELVDEVERQVLRRRIATASDAARVFERVAGEPYAPLERLRAATTPEDHLAWLEGLLPEMARQAAPSGAGLPVEATPEGRMAERILQAGKELAKAAQAGPREPGRTGRSEAVPFPAMLREALDSGAVTVRDQPLTGAVRIASPYGMRAKRLDHLVLASAQEGGLSSEPRSPFLTETQRRALRMSEPLDPDLIDRYLFLTCLAAPTRTFRVSYRSSDELGKPAYPSPLIAELEALFPAGSLSHPEEDRRAGQAVFEPARAPSEAELRRSLAAAPADRLEGLEMDEDRRSRLFGQIAATAAVHRDARLLRSLEHPAILADLGRRREVGATTIEDFTSCPYRWLLRRELSPRPIRPDPQPQVLGNLLHEALKQTYAGHPGELPRPGTLEQWIERSERAVEEAASRPGAGLDPESPQGRVMLARARRQLAAYLRRESEREEPRFRPAMIEARFSDEGEADLPAIPFDGWSLSATIDRVDLGPDGAVVLDYKTGSRGTLKLNEIEKLGRVQLQLYLHAVREGLSRPPVAGLYVPLAAGGRKPRGMFGADSAEELADLELTHNDKAADLDGLIQRAVEDAGAAVQAMRAGLLEHDPLTCPDHLEHPMVRELIPDESDFG